MKYSCVRVGFMERCMAGKDSLIKKNLSYQQMTSTGLSCVQLLSVQNRKELRNLGECLKYALFLRSQHD